MPRLSYSSLFSSLAITAASGVAVAGPGVTLDAGKLNVAVNAEINTSSGKVAKPLSLAPDVSYGVSDDLTVSLVHSTFATTGFRGQAGRGLCLRSTDDGCTALYNNVGGEALYALAKGPFSAAANVGFHALNIDAGFYAAKVGAKVKYTAGQLVFSSQPSLFLGVTDRDKGNKESLFVPVLGQFKVSPQFLLGLGTGIKGPIWRFSNNWEVSLGASAVYNMSPALSLGASWTFGKLLGGADATGVDYRAVHVWGSYTL